MNRRYFASLGLCAGLGLTTSAFSASAPVAPPAAGAVAGLPNDIKRSEKLDDARIKTIRAFIDAQLGKITSGQVTDQQDARDLLVRECDTSSTAAYVDSYIEALVAALPKAIESGDHHSRLNVAVVIGRIAERTKSLRLKAAAMDLLGDKDDGVVIWGARTVRSLVLPQLRISVSKDEPLLTKVVPAVADNLGGYIVQELYEGYRLNILTERRNLTPDMLKAVIPPMLELFGKRVALYAQALPDEPQSETLATSFLGDNSVWTLMTEEQKSQTLQHCSTLVAGAGKYITTLDVKDAASRARRDELVQTVRLVSSAVSVIAQAKADKNLENAAGTMAQLNPTFDPQTVSKMCTDFAADIARSAKPATPGK